MISAAVLDAMLAAGATAEVIAAAMRADRAEDEARVERKRAGNAERQRRFRAAHSNASNALVTLHNASNAVTELPIIKHVRAPAPALGVVSSSSSVGTGFKKEKKENPDFVSFWERYPHRVGKGDARKAWPKALEKAGDLAVILNGVQRYIRDKPPDCPPCNPSTWLNQERWADEPRYAGKTTDGEVLYKFSTVEEVMARKATNGR